MVARERRRTRSAAKGLAARPPKKPSRSDARLFPRRDSRRPTLLAVSRRTASPAGAALVPARNLCVTYAELAVTTNYSFLRGASHPGQFVEQAAYLGYAAIGIADRNSLAGVVRAYEEWGKRRAETRPKLLVDRKSTRLNS